MDPLSSKNKRTQRRRDVIRFKVYFTDMTEEDYAFLRQMAEDIKAQKAAEKEEKKRCRKAS